MIDLTTYPKQDEQPGASGGGSAAPAPTATPAPPAAPSPAPAATPAPTSTALSGGSDVKPLAESIPEKYRVKNEAGEFDQEASMRKVLEGHSALEKRMGSGDAPPKTPEDYKLEGLPETVNMEDLKKDEKYTGFLKAAHAKGMTNAQVSFAINEWISRSGGQFNAPTEESATAELRKVWADEQTFGANQKAAFRAASAVAQKAGLTIEEVNQAVGNNPVAIRLLAAMGAEMKEDSPPVEAGGAVPLEFKAKASELRDELGKLPLNDPRRKQIRDQLDAMYNKQYAS